MVSCRWLRPAKGDSTGATCGCSCCISCPPCCGRGGDSSRPAAVVASGASCGCPCTSSFAGGPAGSMAPAIALCPGALAPGVAVWGVGCVSLALAVAPPVASALVLAVSPAVEAAAAPVWPSARGRSMWPGDWGPDAAAAPTCAAAGVRAAGAAGGCCTLSPGSRIGPWERCAGAGPLPSGGRGGDGLRLSVGVRSCATEKEGLNAGFARHPVLRCVRHAVQFFPWH